MPRQRHAAPRLTPPIRPSEFTGFLLGIGTGRSGLRSLAKILSQQRETQSSYEEPPLLPWKPSDGERVVRERFARFRQNGRSRIPCDVASFYLPYLEAAIAAEPGIRILCLRRPRDRSSPASASGSTRHSPCRPTTGPTSPHPDGTTIPSGPGFTLNMPPRSEKRASAAIGTSITGSGGTPEASSGTGPALRHLRSPQHPGGPARPARLRGDRGGAAGRGQIRCQEPIA